MAAVAAKYAHCQVRAPVPYRRHAPFRPDVVAPLDFALRAAELHALERELDRAVLGIEDYEQLLLESVLDTPGPGGAFRADRARPLGPSAEPSPPVLGPRRTQFLVNTLRVGQETVRFRPPWSEGTVLDLHAALLNHLGLAAPLGEFRAEPHLVRSPSGAPLSETCPPERIGAELRAVLAWVDQYGATLHPVVPATILLEAFWSIRPFEVGSTTVGRAIAIAYLQGGGFPNAALVPVDRTVADSPATLARLLLWSQATASYTEIVDYLVDRLALAYLTAVERWIGRTGATPDLDEVALRVLSRTRRSPGWFSPEEATRWVGRRSRATVRRHLNDLAARGYLEAVGRTRGRRYRAASPHAAAPALLARLLAPPEAPEPAEHPPAVTGRPSAPRSGPARSLPRGARSPRRPP